MWRSGANGWRSGWLASQDGEGTMRQSCVYQNVFLSNSQVGQGWICFWILALLHRCWNWNLRHKQVTERDSPSQPRLRSARRRTESPAATSSSAVSLLTCLSVCSPARCLQDWPPAAIYSPGCPAGNLVSPTTRGLKGQFTHSHTAT